MNINPFDILKNANAIKDQVARLQEELREITATGSAGGNLVRVTLNGHFECISVELDPVTVDPRDIPMLQDLIAAAAHDAHRRVQEIIKERLGPLSGRLSIPGISQ